VERRAWDRRHRLQPDAIRDPHRRLQPRTGRADGGGRLRRRNPEFQDPLVSRNLRFETPCGPSRRDTAFRSGLSRCMDAELARVSGAIVGARSREQVDGWIAAGNLTLDPRTWLKSRAAQADGSRRRATRPVRSTTMPEHWLDTR